MEGNGDSGSGLDEALLRLVARQLGQLTLVERVSIFLRGENPAVYGVGESEALVRTPERSAFWGRA
jgi:hypothetical protein